MGIKDSIKNVYENKYKTLLIIPFLMLLLALAQIGYQMSTEGDFIHRGVDLKGGIEIEFSDIEIQDTKALAQQVTDKLPQADVAVRRNLQEGGFVIEASDVESDELIATLQELVGPFTEDDYQSQTTSASLGESFFKETFFAIALAFLFMGLAVFITFRKYAPSAAVILAALSDIIVTLAIFNLTEIRLAKGALAGFLMLIGYSVDTDILLSTKVLKRREGTVMDRVYSAMKTGLTMNFTTLAAVIVALFVTEAELIRQVMLILLIGLFVDMINTWIQNVGILRWYLEGEDES
ncbi:MAG: protein translocase subunit SecF [Candidatus Nanoarchaeia archaeon]